MTISPSRALFAVLTAALASCATVGGPKPRTAQPAALDPEAEAAFTSAESLQSFCDTRLTRSDTHLAAFLATRDAPREALRRYSEAEREVYNAAQLADAMATLSPDSAVREAAKRCSEAADRRFSRLSVDRQIHDALLALKPEDPSWDESDRRLLALTVRDQRRAGAELDDAARKEIGELSARVSDLVRKFFKAASAEPKTMDFSEEELAGAPADFLARLPKAEGGKRTVSTRDSDAGPMLDQVRDAAVRRRYYELYTSIGFPQNLAVLDELLQARAALAKARGYPTWAHYDAEPLMVRTPETAERFVLSLADGARGAAAEFYQVLLARKRQEAPEATEVGAWERSYYVERLRKERYDVDPSEVSRYFEVEQTVAGVLDAFGRLYGLRYVPVPAAPVWHPSVRAYDVLDGERPIARIYLDLFARPDKARSAGSGALQRGVGGVQQPVPLVRASFAAPAPGERTLLRWDEVRTLLHEFGHLTSRLLGGVDARHAGLSGFAAEFDFLEVPSFLHEPMRYAPEVMTRFAKDEQGRPIPAALLARLEEADRFGRHLQTASYLQLMLYALKLHEAREPGSDPEALLRELHPKFLPYPYFETHVTARFLHLGSYGPRYFTYAWARAIAREVEPAFVEAHWSGEVGRRFREKVLGRGGSREASAQVEDFLGRRLDPEKLVDSYLR